MNVYDKLKQNLKKLRIQAGLTQQELAEKTGIARANIARYETGENIPPLDIIVILADFYDISLDELIDRD